MDVVAATEAHVDDAVAWAKTRGVAYEPEMFSAHGYVVPGVAGVWLYLSPGGFAFLEHLVANPDSTAADRSAALNAVVTRAIEAATEFGARYLFTSISLPAVEKRAIGHGFRTLMGMKL